MSEAFPRRTFPEANFRCNFPLNFYEGAGAVRAAVESPGSAAFGKLDLLRANVMGGFRPAGRTVAETR